MIDKRQVLQRLREQLAAELAAATASQTTAQEGAIHEETRAEDPKDTRAIEAQYLARGLAERVERLRDDVALLGRLELATFGPDDPIDLTALVGLEREGDDAESVYLVVPCAGGETVEADGVAVRALTPDSPLGAALVGRRVDDDVTLELPGRRMAARVAWVR